MEKKVYLLTADLRKTTHRPMMITDFTYQDLIKSLPEFADSEAIKNIYADPKIERLIIMVYVDRAGVGRRRIAHSPSGIPVTDEHILDTIKALCSSIGLHMTFHSEQEAKKILPTDKQERDLISMIRENGKPVDLRDFGLSNT